MARTVTQLQLRTWVRSKGDWPDVNFVTNAEINDELNAGIASLYRLLAAAKGQEYFRATTNLSTANGVDTVAYPATFFELINLWWDPGGGHKIRIPRLTPSETEDQITGQGWIGDQLGINVRYSLTLGGFLFVPTPLAIYTVKCDYIAAPVRLAADGDTFDGYGGFEEYPVWYAVSTFLQKEESDPSVALARMAQIKADIIATAARDHSEPMRAQDVRGWPMSRGLARWR